MERRAGIFRAIGAVEHVLPRRAKGSQRCPAECPFARQSHRCSPGLAILGRGQVEARGVVAHSGVDKIEAAAECGSGDPFADRGHRVLDH